jgi:hypothetical protein
MKTKEIHCLAPLSQSHAAWPEQGVRSVQGRGVFSTSLLQDGRLVRSSEKSEWGPRAHNELKGEKASVHARASHVVLPRAALCQTP